MATNVGIPPERVPLVFTEFVNYWRAKPGKDARKLDWDLTWENRCIQVAGRVAVPPRPDSDPAWRNSRAPLERTTRGDETNVVTPDSAVRAHQERLKRERDSARVGGGFT